MGPEVQDLFEKHSLSGIALRTRLVRSATWEGLCDPEGRPTEKLIDHYRRLTRGGVGLNVTGFACVADDGRCLPGSMADGEVKL